jgi:hypothetical protein
VAMFSPAAAHLKPVAEIRPAKFAAVGEHVT